MGLNPTNQNYNAEGQTLIQQNSDGTFNSAYPDGNKGVGGGDSPLTMPDAVGDYFVSNAGSDAAAGTEGAPFATVLFALQTMAAGETVIVMNTITETISDENLAANAGTVGAYKTIAGANANTIINGRVTSNVGESEQSDAFIVMRDLWFKHQNLTNSFSYIPSIKFYRCFFEGGPLSGNTAIQVPGNYQTYDQCGWFGIGGRYNLLAYQRTDLVFRHCLLRVDAGWTGDGTNPNGNFQIYSTSRAKVIQCVCIDSEDRAVPASETLAEFVVTTNQGPANDLRYVNTYAAKSTMLGYQLEGGATLSATMQDCVSIDNTGGLVGNCQGVTPTIDIIGGHYSDNSGLGVGGYGNETITLTGATNITGNGGNRLDNVAAGDSTDIAYTLTNPDSIGTVGEAYGDTNDESANTEKLFPFPNEANFKAAFSTVRNVGFCLTSIHAELGITV